MRAKRKLSSPMARAAGPRALVPAARSSPLPTVAALMSALAIVAASSSAHAIVRTKDAEPEDAGSEVGVAAGDAGENEASVDAAYCDPRGDVPIQGGIRSTQVRGFGCGCGAAGDDDSATAALVTTAALGLALTRRSRRSD